jgi:hypothetical protein
MNTSAKTAAFVLLAGSLWGWSQSSPSSDSQPLVSEVAASFTNYQQITKTVVFVNPELAMLCRGASKEEVEAARIKFGPHANTGILIYMNKLAADAFYHKRHCISRWVSDREAEDDFTATPTKTGGGFTRETRALAGW